ncbi:hypothetical protein ABTL75_20100, partial [Acinetobacter baumannii]
GTRERAWATYPYDPHKGAASKEEPTCPLDGRTGGGVLTTIEGETIFKYRIEKGRIERGVITKHYAGYDPLCNFAAAIEREIVATDGLESEVLFEIRGYTSTGRPLPVALVKSGEFSG